MEHVTTHNIKQILIQALKNNNINFPTHEIFDIAFNEVQGQVAYYDVIIYLSEFEVYHLAEIAFYLYRGTADFTGVVNAVGAYKEVKEQMHN